MASPMILKPFLLFCLVLGAPIFATAQDYNIQNVARLDILPGYPTANGHMIAARIQLRAGWKTYWRSPGGNGIPPVFDWSGSENVGAVSFHWPEPSVFTEKNVRTIGYKRQLVLPIAITPRQKGKPILLKGEVTFGVCEDICIPVKARFSLNVAGTDQPSRTAIRTALAQKPITAKAAGVRNVSCEITPTSDGFKLRATVKTRSALPAQTFTIFEFQHPEVWIEQYRASTSGTTLTASANLYAYGDTPLILDRSKITLTLLGGNRAIELRGCPS
jgi:DsbC/DsbD-like thiol-disulfide interchange protein